MDDRYVVLAESAIRSVTSSLRPGAYLVDVLPWRMYINLWRSCACLIDDLVKYVPRWMPGARFKADAKEGYDLSSAMRFVPYYETKEKMVGESCRYSRQGSTILVLHQGTRDSETIYDKATSGRPHGQTG